MDGEYSDWISNNHCHKNGDCARNIIEEETREKKYPLLLFFRRPGKWTYY